MAERSKALTVFGRSNIRIAGSKPARGMDAGLERKGVDMARSLCCYLTLYAFSKLQSPYKFYELPVLLMPHMIIISKRINVNGNALDLYSESVSTVIPFIPSEGVRAFPQSFQVNSATVP
jgi:hypothetical protein